jgi:hypothetical protein
MSSQLTIMLSGMVAEAPGQGGAAWAVLQYVLGLKRLGHRVYLIEPMSQKALRPAGSRLQESENASYFRQVVRHFGLADTSALMIQGTSETIGMDYQSIVQIAQHSDLLLNISGLLLDPKIIDRIPIRAYLDLDPAFVQLWQVAYGIDMHFAEHTHHVTIGRAIGLPECPIPTCDLKWITTNQPIVLDYWPVADEITYPGLTTVGNWRAYGSAEYLGQFYGQKVHSLRQFMDLPRRCPERFMLAMGIHPDEKQDLAALQENRWELLDPAVLTDTPWAYQKFIRSSKAEFGIAKSGYVVSRCGWFSDRSLCYLASGRPVIAQETGFSRFLPTGEGLFTFNTADDVLSAVDALNREYPRHVRAARSIAEAHFDSDTVLRRLLDQIGGA